MLFERPFRFHAHIVLLPQNCIADPLYHTSLTYSDIRGKINKPLAVGYGIKVYWYMSQVLRVFIKKEGV